jgi:NAD(P)-dependent dehydrogenase (short-subunit alcohol dehydrogenase family)
LGKRAERNRFRREIRGMDHDLEGKRALVTGAASGIGRAIAEALAREGATVALHGRDNERTAETLNTIEAAGGSAYPVAADLLDSAEIKAMCGTVLERLGGIDIIVNNAGWADFAPVPDMPEEMWDRIMDTNVKAPYLVSRHLLPAMLAQKSGGCILFNASTSGKSADAEWTAYNASKHAVLQFMKCLAMEVGEQDIRVNAICPGWAESKMATAAIEKTALKNDEDFDDAYSRIMRGNMLGALIGPESLADMAVYLAGRHGRYITGQAINVCGGVNYH